MKNVPLAALIAAGAVLGNSAASAADLPTRTYTKAPAAVVEPTYNWSGFYVGGNLGGAWGRSDYSLAPFLEGDPQGVAQLTQDGAARLHMSNLSGGAQAGYNWQINHLLLGLEADVQYIGLRRTNIFTQNGPLPTLTPPYVLT